MKNNRATLALWIVMLMGKTVPSLSQTPFWQQINRPYGGNATCIVFDSAGGTLISGGTGLYLSTDRGLGWIEPDDYRPRDSLSMDPKSAEMYGMVVRPGGEIFAISDWGYTISTDHGRTWHGRLRKDGGSFIDPRVLGANAQGDLFVGTERIPQI